MNLNSQPDVYHLRNFENLLYDAVHLLYLAHDVDSETDEHGYQFSYSRTAILNTLLLFECGANCCLDALALPKTFAEDIDKLPFLSKYEFFLSRVNPKAEFDRGCKETQAVAELKVLRDEYVHPKVRKKPYSKADDWGANFGQTTFLKIPKDANLWENGHAVIALKAANEFFNLFFLSWCQFDTDTVCSILLSSDPAEIPGMASVYIDCIGGLSRAVKEFAIDFGFLGKTISNQ